MYVCKYVCIYLTVGVFMLQQHINLRHHGGYVHAGRGWIQRNLAFVTFRTYFFTYLPSVSTVYLAHWKLAVTGSGHDNGSNGYINE